MKKKKIFAIAYFNYILNSNSLCYTYIHTEEKFTTIAYFIKNLDSYTAKICILVDKIVEVSECCRQWQISQQQKNC